MTENEFHAKLIIMAKEGVSFLLTENLINPEMKSLIEEAEAAGINTAKSMLRFCAEMVEHLIAIERFKQ